MICSAHQEALLKVGGGEAGIVGKYGPALFRKPVDVWR